MFLYKWITLFVQVPCFIQEKMKFLLICCFLLGTTCAKTIDSDSFQPIIEQVNSMQTTWKADPNFSPDVTISSIKRLLGALESGPKLPIREKHNFPDEEIPDEFDARKHWPNCPTISSISDQSHCGSCWAAATGDSFSDRLCIATKGQFTTPLSVEHLLSCCETCGAGCSGGFPSIAWSHFKNIGIVTGGGYNSSIGCQPYALPPCEHHISGSFPPCSSLPEYDTPTCIKKCTNEGYKIPLEQDIHKVKDEYSVYGVKEIQKEIMMHGPVAATFTVFADFPTYKSGVYTYTTGKLLGGHVVRVIGWGTENGTPYWLIANSWNNHWGDQGFFKILRGENECDIESEITAGIPLETSLEK